MTNLEGARIKLARASRHIDEVRVAARAYLDSAPYEITHNEEPNGDLVYCLKIIHSIPNEWAAIVGDAVHNMRAALDLLAWQLGELNGSQPARDTCFPIGQSQSAYQQSLRRALGGANSSAVRMVRRLKPYPGGNNILVQLHSLDIVDKHRLVLIVGAAQKHVIVNFKMEVPWENSPVQFPSIALNHADRQFPLTDGAEVFRVMAAARQGSFIPEHRLVFELAFGDVSEVNGLPLIDTLDSMHKHVTRIILMADRLFFQ